MTDAVAQYLAKYGPRQSASDPVASYLSRYRPPSTASTPTIQRAPADITAAQPTPVGGPEAPEAGNVVFGAMQAIPQLAPGMVQFAHDVAQTFGQAQAGQFAQAGQSAVSMGIGFLEPVADVAVLPFQIAAGHLTPDEQNQRLNRAGGTLMSLLVLEGGGRLVKATRAPVEIAKPTESIRPMVGQPRGFDAVLPTTDPIPLVSATPTMPPVGENLLRDMGDFSGRLYRETSIEHALELVDPRLKTDMTFDDVHVATSPDLALGQGTNRGVLVEFAPQGLRGQVATTKPMWAQLYQQGEAEFRMRLNRQGQYQAAVRTVTVRPNASGSRGETYRFRRSLSGWGQERLADGSIRYTKPPQVSPGVNPQERGGIVATPDPLEARVDVKNLTPHSQAIQAQISVGERSHAPIGLRDIYARLVRRVAPIEHAAQQLARGEKIPLSHDPGASAILASGSGARTEAFLETGPFRLTPEGNTELTGTPSYQAILAPLRGKLNAYRRYEVAARSLELAGQPTPKATGIPVEAALAEVSGVDPLVKAAHEQSVQYRRDVLQYWQDAGGISDAAVQAMRQLSDEYVPFQRVFDGKDVRPAIGQIGRVAQQVRRLLGSERRIVDPIESTVDQTRRMIRAADLQRVGSQLVDLAEAYPENAVGLLEKVSSGPRSPSPGTTIQAPLSTSGVRLHKAATDRGIAMSPEVAGELAAHLTEEALGLKDGTIRVFRNGQAETWRVSPELANGLKALSPQHTAWWLQLLGFPAKGLKVGITTNPAFAVFNFIRDTFDATLQSRYGFRLGLDSFKGFWESVKKGTFREELHQGGGAYADIVGGTRRSTQATAARIVPQSVASKVVRTALHPIQALKLFGRPFEEAARLGEFMRARKSGASVVESALAARRVTTDFQMMGSDMQGFAQMTAFLNPAIQSMDTMVRAAATNPGRLFAMGTGAISIPTLLLWLANRNDQDIQDLRKTNAGLLYWFVRGPSGEIQRIPKPFLWGQVFGTGMESALDKAFTDDPAAINRFASGVLSQTGSNVIPNAVQTYFALKDNKDPFFGTPIVPDQLTNVDPQYQATEFTTNLARHIGETFKISPARFEFTLRSLTGTLGMDALKGASNVVDRLTGESHIEPTPIKADWPVIGRFFARNPSSAVEPIRTFYDSAKHYARVTATIDLLRMKRPEELAAYLDAHQTDLAIAGMYEAGRAELSALRRQVEAIRGDPGVSAVDKRIMIDETLRQMASVARQINQAVAQVTP